MNIMGILLQVCITCTFSETEDLNACISLAANSIGLTTLPSYLVEKGEQYEWIKKTQVGRHLKTHFTALEMFLAEY